MNHYNRKYVGRSLRSVRISGSFLRGELELFFKRRIRSLATSLVISPKSTSGQALDLVFRMLTALSQAYIHVLLDFYEKSMLCAIVQEGLLLLVR